MGRIDVAVAVIHRVGRILISQRRKDDAFGNFWEFPGGKIEPGETPEQCLAREIREELGVTVRILVRLTPIDHVYQDFEVRLFPFLCTVESGEPLALASQRLQWATADEVSALSFPAANAGLLKEIGALLPGKGVNTPHRNGLNSLR